MTTSLLSPNETRAVCVRINEAVVIQVHDNKRDKGDKPLKGLASTTMPNGGHRGVMPHDTTVPCHYQRLPRCEDSVVMLS